MKISPSSQTLRLDDELLPIIEARNSKIENSSDNNSKPLDSEFKPISVIESSNDINSNADYNKDTEYF